MADRPVVVDTSISLSKSPAIDVAPVSIKDPKSGASIASTESQDPKSGIEIDAIGSSLANPKDGIDINAIASKDPKSGILIDAITSKELRKGVGINPDLPGSTLKNGAIVSSTSDPKVYAKA